ncbi:C17 cyclopropane fatty acid synthase CfaB [Pseudomonas luteola]
MLPHLPARLANLSLPLRIRVANGPSFDLSPNPVVTLTIKDPSLMLELPRVTLDSLGEAYVEQRIDVDGPIQEVIKVGTALSDALSERDASNEVPHEVHDKEMDAAAISYHYDLSNEFYQLWLDPEMVYSCAYFETGTEDLATAQLAKLRHLCRKLRLQPGEKLLDVGCGWAGLARVAAREFGADVFGITLSQAQLEWAQARNETEGLSGKIHLELMDYRDLPEDGRFDKAVSVGMFEHVGYANLNLYFQKLFGAVRSGGLVMNHGITARHADGRPAGHGGGEFIERYVFPHGELPHVSLAIAKMSEAGLEVVDVESLRMHYARTLDFWSERLESNLDRAASLVSEQALRIWRLYLPGCAYAFRQNWVNLHQILATKPHEDGSTEVPWSRIYMYK